MSRYRAAVVLVLSLFLASCFVGTALDTLKSRPTGTVQLTSDVLGDHTLAPAACASGERQLFLGADFLDSAGITTRLIIDPDGAVRVRLFSAARPLDPGVSFRRTDCSRLEFSLERTGWRINNVYAVRVSLEFECRTGPAASARGTIAADSCY